MSIYWSIFFTFCYNTMPRKRQVTLFLAIYCPNYALFLLFWKGWLVWIVFFCKSVFPLDLNCIVKIYQFWAIEFGDRPSGVPIFRKISGILVSLLSFFLSFILSFFPFFILSFFLTFCLLLSSAILVLKNCLFVFPIETALIHTFTSVWIHLRGYYKLPLRMIDYWLLWYWESWGWTEHKEHERVEVYGYNFSILSLSIVKPTKLRQQLKNRRYYDIGWKKWRYYDIGKKYWRYYDIGSKKLTILWYWPKF